MTLKQRRFKAEIKKGAKTKWEAMIKAGYSPKSRTIYQPHTRTTTNRLIDEALPKEDEIENDFVIGKKLALQSNDLTNYNRANENLARIKGMFLDKSEVTNRGASQTIIVDNAGRFTNRLSDNKTIPQVVSDEPKIIEPNSSSLI